MKHRQAAALRLLSLIMLSAAALTAQSPTTGIFENTTDVGPVLHAGGGKPTVVAYFYGGQGSINTPSWSPDGKRVAFVSNSKI